MMLVWPFNRGWPLYKGKNNRKTLLGTSITGHFIGDGRLMGSTGGCQEHYWPPGGLDCISLLHDLASV